MYWKSWPFGAGGAPIWPAATSWLCCWIDVDDVLRRQAARLHEIRVQPDAHGVLAGAEDR